jgi:hypothetical protein
MGAEGRGKHHYRRYSYSRVSHQTGEANPSIEGGGSRSRSDLPVGEFKTAKMYRLDRGGEQ